MPIPSDMLSQNVLILEIHVPVGQSLLKKHQVGARYRVVTACGQRHYQYDRF